MAIAYTQTINLLYIYFYIWGLNLRLDNINLHQSLFFIICIDHYCHHYWTSKSLLNLWEYTQGSDITNKWVVHFVIVSESNWGLLNSLLYLNYYSYYSYIPIFFLSLKFSDSCNFLPNIQTLCNYNNFYHSPSLLYIGHTLV